MKLVELNIFEICKEHNQRFKLNLLVVSTVLLSKNELGGGGERIFAKKRELKKIKINKRELRDFKIWSS